MGRALSFAAALLVGASALTPSDSRPRSAMSFDDVLAARRSTRTFATRDLSEVEIERIVWAAQGITASAGGGRTAPSAGATYPLEIYVVTRAGVFHYDPAPHALARVRSGDRRAELARAAGGQSAVRDAAIDVVIAAVPERTAARYGARAERYVFIETGHVGQNVLLEAVALGLGAVPIGAFDDEQIAAAAGLETRERAVYLIAVGPVSN
jgi:SagB-type dehydrogenase family enzyme